MCACGGGVRGVRKNVMLNSQVFLKYTGFTTLISPFGNISGSQETGDSGGF